MNRFLPPRLSAHLPTRVSRLYPVFSLVLALTCSILFYAWQSTLLDLDSLSKVDQNNKALQAQIDNLTAQQKLDKAQLTVQQQKVADATTQLSDLQKQLSQKNADLATTESQLGQAQTQLKQQQSQLSQNASELEQLRSRPPLFSFQNDANVANFDQKEAELKTLITAAYSTIQDVYGQPYLLNSVTITFVSSFDISGSAGEIVIQNSSAGIKVNIHMKDFDKDSFQDNNTIIHEMIHGFHGVAVFNTSAFEEGITVAAADAVMSKMTAAGSLPSFSHLYLTTSDQQYADWNQTLDVPADNQAFYSNPDVAEVYQLIGTAWYRLYQADPNLFKDINANYYPKAQKGLTPDDAMVLNAIRAVLPTYHGQSIDTYLAANRAFNPS